MLIRTYYARIDENVGKKAWALAKEIGGYVSSYRIGSLDVYEVRKNDFEEED